MGPPPGDERDDSSGTGVFGSSLTGSQTTTLASLASLLGTAPEDLLDALKQGTSLSDLVTSKGIDSTSLANVLQDGLLFDQTM